MPAPKKEVKSPRISDEVEKLRNDRCTVYYEKSVTKNLGNYESAKVTVGVTLPVNPTDSEVAIIKETLEIGDDIVTRELEIQLKELVEDK